MIIADRLCPECGIRQREKRYGRAAGSLYPTCKRCSGRGYHSNPERGREYARRSWAKVSGRRAAPPPCSLCGFIPEHWCQIDRDHIDGNHQNDDPSNIQLICANCHRLKTWRNRDMVKQRAPG